MILMSFVNLNLLYCFLCFLALHIGVWFSTNLQLIEGQQDSKSLFIAVILAIPISVLAYYATRFGYLAFEQSAWAIRFFGFAISYFVFPILTWWLLGESMLNFKTLICVLLSFLIIAIQIFM